MKKSLIALALSSLTLLSACSDEADKKAAAANCGDPAVLQSVRDNLMQTIKQEARLFAQKDGRQFIDADKVIAAGSDLNITLNNAKPDGNACHATLTIQVPDTIWQAAKENTPFVYDRQEFDTVVRQRAEAAKLNYNSSGTFTQTLNYALTSANNSLNVAYNDSNLTTAAQTVTTALLPYGVKSMLMLNGKAVSKEDALKQLGTPTTAAEPAAASETIVAGKNPKDILENNTASSVFTPLPASAPRAENLVPRTSDAPVSNISPAELEQARSRNSQADGDINQTWNHLDQTVQKELLNEQRDWIYSKNSSCHAAAARTDNAEEAEYLQLQCDTRMTRERIQYLKGYSIQ